MYSEFRRYCGELHAAAVADNIRIGVDCELLSFNVPEDVRKSISATFTTYDFDFREMGRDVFRTVDRVIQNSDGHNLVKRLSFQPIRHNTHGIGVT